MIRSNLRRVLSLSFALLLAAVALPAQVNLSPFTLYITFSPVLESGADPEGFASSTWTMRWELPETYSPGLFSAPAGVVSNGTLSIAGSTRLDGTYTITSQSGDFAFYPFVGGGSAQIMFFAFDTGFNSTAFSFAGVTVTDFGASGTALTSQPELGSPILVEHFHGATISSTTSRQDFDSFAVDNGSGISRYTFSNVTVIPEPGTYAAVVGLFALGLIIATRRRPRRSVSGRLTESGDAFRPGEGDAAPPGPAIPQATLPSRHPSTFRFP